MGTIDLGRFTKSLGKNKYVWLVFALGLLLLLLPRRSGGETAAAPAPAAGLGDPLSASGIPLDTEAERMAALLSQIRGVGETRVLLSGEGAVVVCAGADDARVRLNVTNAVSAYTGLGSDQITVMKLK